MDVEKISKDIDVDTDIDIDMDWLLRTETKKGRLGV